MSGVKTFLDNSKIGVEHKHKLIFPLAILPHKNKEKLTFSKIYD